MATTTLLLVDRVLGGPGTLEAFVRSRRAEGKPWRFVARDLYELHDIDLTHEVLRQWFPDQPTEASA